MQKIKIIPEKCIACGLCVVYAQQFFDYYDNGVVKFFDSEKNEQEISNESLENVLKAIKKCPTQALKFLRKGLSG